MVVCGLAAILVCFVRIGQPALWEPDEGRYAEIPREMVVTGDYVTPHNDGVRYFEKPPLVYWATAASLRIFGHNEFAVRFQAAAASVGSVLVTAMLGEAMFGASAGLISALALLLSPLFFIFARFATPDPLLAFFFSSALACFYFAARQGNFYHGASRKLMLAAAGLLALGTLTKGPVALILGGAIGLLWLIVERRTKDIVLLRWPECIAIYLAIVAPWFVLVSLRNPEFPRFFFLHEHVQRFLESTEHGWGPWFFILIVIVGTWPWLYFAPLAFAARSTYEGDSSRDRGALRFLAIWFLVVFVFFSIPRSKLGEYILPALPPIAILAGTGLDRLRQMPRKRIHRLLGSFSAINLVPLIIVGAVLALRLPLKLADKLISDGVVLVLILAASSAAIWLAAYAGASVRIISAGIGILSLLVVAMIAKGRVDATPAFSYRGLATAASPYLKAGCILASYRHFVQSAPFYTQHREVLVGYRGELGPLANSPEAAESFIATDSQLRTEWSRKACMILIANRYDLAHLGSFLNPVPVILAKEGKKVMLLNKPSDLQGVGRSRISP
jgi:4-amino-4-deoxy-L-arabinose transferase-like glycosyltransferase